MVEFSALITEFMNKFEIDFSSIDPVHQQLHHCDVNSLQKFTKSEKRKKPLSKIIEV